MKYTALFFVLFPGLLLAQVDLKKPSIVSNKDIIFEINKAGVQTEALRLVGTSGNVSIGTIANTSNALNVSSATLTANYGVAHIYHTDNSSASLSNPGIIISKRYNDNTTSQNFITFEINNSNGIPGSGAGNGRIAGNGANAAAFQTHSDKRLKNNIKGIPNQLDKIIALKPVEFDFKDGSGHQTGFIAQDMKEVYPDAVGVGDKGMMTITGWDKTSARLVKAIQELKAKNDSLEARLEELEKHIAKIDSYYNEYEQ